MKHSENARTITSIRGPKGLLIAAMAVLLLPLAAEAGNGNGNGNSNRNENASSNGDDNRGQGRNERGQQARNLGRLNAANANENAFLNASPNSTPGQIQQYRAAIQESSTLIADQNIAAQDLRYLDELTAEDIAVMFPEAGTYDAALAGARLEYEATTSVAKAAEEERTAILTALTGDRSLTESDLAAFHEMLGL
jgi:hypothetical protein